MTIDDPDPSTTNRANNFASTTAPESSMADVGAGVAGIGAASAVAAASNAPRRTPTATTESFPNPYSVAPSSADGYQRNGAPPTGPTSDGSVVSESLYGQQSRHPLHIANPSEYPPIDNPQPMSMPMPVPEASNPSAYPNSSDSGTSGPQAGTSFAPYVHQDAGSAAGPARRTKEEEARRAGEEEHEQREPPPPAYEA